MKKYVITILATVVLPLTLLSGDAPPGGKMPAQGTAVGGIGADGLYHFLLVGNDGSLAASITGGGDASAANQTAVQANAGSDATKAVSVQGITGGKAVPVSIAATQSVNVAQINGVTPLMGAGNTGTGSARVTIASDQAVLTFKELTTSSTNGQVTATGSAATLVAANAARRKLTIRNQDTSLSVYVGEATVSSSNGLLLKAGESRVITSPELMQLIAPSGSPVVDYMDESY